MCCALQELAGDVLDKLQGTSIYLVGMMGSGKSTVGRWEHRDIRVGRTFVRGQRTRSRVFSAGPLCL